MKKIAILSASGSGKKRTIPALKNSSVAKVVAIHGRPSDKLHGLSKEVGIQAFTTLEEIENLDFDILYIASPPFLHADQLERFAKKSIPIICEKPLCVSREDKTEIERIVSAPFMVANHLRHQKAIKEIKDLIQSSELGEVQFAQFQWNFQLNKSAPSAEWKLNPTLGGDNPFYDAGIHVIDMAIHLFGKPRRVYATGRPAPEKGRFENATAMIQYDNFNLVLNSSSVQTLVGNDLLVYFENGFVRAPQAFSEKSITEFFVHTADQKIKKCEFDEVNLYAEEVESFCRHIDGIETDFVGASLSDGVSGVEVLHAISESIASDAFVEV